MLPLLMPLLAAAASENTPPFTFCCSPENDLYRVACEAGFSAVRVDTPEEAIEQAPRQGGVLLLADGYPDSPLAVPEALLNQAREKELRVYLEFPASLPGCECGAPLDLQWERGAVCEGAFGESLPGGTILAIHGCRLVPVEATRPWLVAARVAGYDHAVYGLPERTRPLLFTLPDHGLLVATTKLSHFRTGRYGPHQAWEIIVAHILGWLRPEKEIPTVSWTPTVCPMFGPDAELPENGERQAFERGIAWYERSRLLIDASWLPHLTPLFQAGTESGSGVPHTLPPGDGSQGMLEGYAAAIHHDGSQPVRYVIRNDCVSESAMALAFGRAVGKDSRSGEIAANLADFICFDSVIQGGVRGDPTHPCFGLMAWGTNSETWEKACYGDDNARSILGLLATAALLGEDRWDQSILEALLANLRTTGALGFRGSRIDVPELVEKGWRYYHDREIVNPSPHYESYLWAAFLWAYRATGYEPFLAKTKSAIRMTMEAYPEGWRWTNGIVQERARMLLCLAWLVRLEDTEQHRQWLMTIAEDLIANQEPCGAIREELGKPGQGQYGAVPSNEAYGTTETPLIQENGDPACDLLYTTNFAFLALHEAVAATGEKSLKAAEDRLAEFLCRIQVRSAAHPELDGAWFRAFDYERWEYWGSSADIGWGAWCIESGWTQGWLTAILGLRLMDTSFWDLTADSRIARHFDEVEKLMAQNTGEPLAPKAE